MELKIDLSPTQERFHTSPSRFRAMICGLGAGKTFSGCLEAVRMALEYPKSSGVIVASTYSNLKDFVVPMITKSFKLRYVEATMTPEDLGYSRAVLTASRQPEKVFPAPNPHIIARNRLGEVWNLSCVGERSIFSSIAHKLKCNGFGAL